MKLEMISQVSEIVVGRFGIFCESPVTVGWRAANRAFDSWILVI